MTGRPPRVSSEDKARFKRQATVLGSAESEDTGDPDRRARLIEETDADRARQGIAPLKTETELHVRARALGLLRR